MNNNIKISKEVEPIIINGEKVYGRIIGKYSASDAMGYLISDDKVEYIGACRRRLWYQYKNVEPSDVLPAKHVRRRQFGKLVEEQEYEYIKKVYPDAITDIKMSYTIKDFVISGRTDIMIPSLKRIIEIKTITGYYKRNMIWGAIPKPYYPHVIQVMHYLWGFKDEGYDNAELYYIDMETGETKSFIITLDIITFNEKKGLKRRIVPVINDFPFSSLTLQSAWYAIDEFHNMLKNNSRPARDYDPLYTEESVDKMDISDSKKKKYIKRLKRGEEFGDKFCDYCPFKSLCIKED